jgi:hypothetical protein
MKWEKWDDFRSLKEGDLATTAERIIAWCHWVNPVPLPPPGTAVLTSRTFMAQLTREHRFVRNSDYIRMDDFVRCCAPLRGFSFWETLVTVAPFVIVAVKCDADLATTIEVRFSVFLDPNDRKQRARINNAIGGEQIRPAYLLQALAQDSTFVPEVTKLFNRVTPRLRAYVHRNMNTRGGLPCQTWMREVELGGSRLLISEKLFLNPYTLTAVPRARSFKSGGLVLYNNCSTKVLEAVIKLHCLRPNKRKFRHISTVVVTDKKRMELWLHYCGENHTSARCVASKKEFAEIEEGENFFIVSKTIASSNFAQVMRLCASNGRLVVDTAHGLKPYHVLTKKISSCEDVPYVWVLCKTRKHYRTQVNLLQCVTKQYGTGHNTEPCSLLSQSLVFENFTYFMTHQLRRMSVVRKTITFPHTDSQFFKYYFKEQKHKLHLHTTQNGYEKLVVMKLGRLGVRHSPLPLQKQIIDLFFYHGSVQHSYLTSLYDIVEKEGPKGTAVLHEFTERPENCAPLAGHQNLCPICITGQEPENLRHLLCGHVFCRDCLRELVHSCSPERCPLCRRDLKYQNRGALLCWPLVPLDPKSSRWKLFHGTALREVAAGTQAPTVNNQTVAEVLKFRDSYGRNSRRILVLGHFSQSQAGVLYTPEALRHFLAGTGKFVFLDTSGRSVLHYLEDLEMLDVEEMWFMNLAVEKKHNRILLECSQGKTVRFFGSEESLMFEKLRMVYQQLDDLDYKLIFHKFTNQKLLLMYMAANTLCGQGVQNEVSSGQVTALDDSCISRSFRWGRKLQGYLLNNQYYFNLANMTCINLLDNTVHNILDCVNLGN